MLQKVSGFFLEKMFLLFELTAIEHGGNDCRHLFQVKEKTCWAFFTMK